MQERTKFQMMRSFMVARRLKLKKVLKTAILAFLDIFKKVLQQCLEELCTYILQIDSEAGVAAQIPVSRQETYAAVSFRPIYILAGYSWQTAGEDHPEQAGEVHGK